MLLDLIMQRRIAHDGNADLRAHLDNADAKRGAEGRTLRIVKRAQSLKVDLAVATAMGCARAFDVLTMSSWTQDQLATFSSGKRV